MVLGEKSRGNIKYEDSGQSPEVGDIGGGVWLGGSGEEIRCWV